MAGWVGTGWKAPPHLLRGFQGLHGTLIHETAYRKHPVQRLAHLGPPSEFLFSFWPGVKAGGSFFTGPHEGRGQEVLRSRTVTVRALVRGTLRKTLNPVGSGLGRGPEAEQGGVRAPQCSGAGGGSHALPLLPLHQTTPHGLADPKGAFGGLTQHCCCVCHEQMAHSVPKALNPTRRSSGSGAPGSDGDLLYLFRIERRNH